MVFSFASTAFAAGTGYADDDQITQTKAVTVMSGMGIINGKEGNNLDPTGDYTREEAAKVIAYMKLGPAVAEAQPKTSKFADVEAGRWSAGYINYCQSKGILSGYAGNFDPKGTLTQAAWLKLLLTTIGYDAKENGLVDNDNWEENALNLALQAGLITAEESKLTFNRETAILYAWNAMNKPVAGAKASYAVKDAYGKVVATFDNVADAILYAGTNPAYTVDIVNTNSLGYQVYNLTCTPGKDDFGRPTTVYSNSKVAGPEGEYAVITDEPVLVLTSAQRDDKAIKAALGKDAVCVKYYANTKTGIDAGGPWNAADMAADAKNGRSYEVYATATRDEYVVVWADTYVDKIGKPTPATPDTKASISLTNPAGGAALKYEYENETFAKDDIVAYTVADGKVVTATKLEGVEGTVTATGTGYIRVDGEQKSFAWKAEGNTSPANGTVCKFFYDEYGYILYCETVNEVKVSYDGFFMVGSNVKTTAEDPSEWWNVKPATAIAEVTDLTTGKTETIKLALVQDKDQKWYYANQKGKPADVAGSNGVDAADVVSNSNAPIDADTIYGYYKLDDGTYVAGRAVDTASAPDRVDTEHTVQIAKGSAIVTTNDTPATKYATDTTNLTVVSKTGAAPAKVTTYTGYKNFPEVYYDNDPDPNVVTKVGCDSVVITDMAGKITDIYVYTNINVGDSPAVNYAMYLETVETYPDGSYMYKFLVNGEETEVVSSDVITGDVALTRGNVGDLKAGPEGKYAFASVAAPADGEVKVIDASTIAIGTTEIAIAEDTVITYKRSTVPAEEAAVKDVEFRDGVQAKVYYAVKGPEKVATLIVITGDVTP